MEYVSANGNKLLVEILRTQSDSNAYSLLTLATRKAKEADQSQNIELGDVGTASIVTGRAVAFFKGAVFVRVTNERANDSQPAVALARLLAATFDKGEDDIPVLVKHLPSWRAYQQNAVYAVNIGPLRDAINNQAILNEISFDGGTEAVTANYGQSQLVIVEFTTPQFAGDNDRRIVAKIQELKTQNQAVPTAYRRVGNYSVFVFNAPDEKTANQLIDQVKYEQVVQWLGDNPHWYERAQNYLLRTTGGVVVAVVEGSIVSLLVCLALGSLIGTMLFRRRRAQQQAASAYSDAGGAVRLNLDELTANRNRHRLLESGKESQSD